MALMIRKMRRMVTKLVVRMSKGDLRVLRVNLLCSCQVLPSLRITPAATWPKY